MKRKLKQNILAGNGETYTLGVACVHKKLPDGTPRVLELIGMDEKINVTAGMEFVTIYLPKYMVRSALAIPKDTGGKDT